MILKLLHIFQVIKMECLVLFLIWSVDRKMDGTIFNYVIKNIHIWKIVQLHHTIAATEPIFYYFNVC